MGWLILLAFFLVGLPLFDIIGLIRWIIGKPVRDDESDRAVLATAPPRCPTCMIAAGDAAAKFCPRCGATLTAVGQGKEASRAKAIWTRLFFVGLIFAAAAFAAFKLARAESKLSTLIDPNHPPTISFGTSSAPAPADDDKSVKWEIRLQRK